MNYITWRRSTLYLLLFASLILALLKSMDIQNLQENVKANLPSDLPPTFYGFEQWQRHTQSTGETLSGHSITKALHGQYYLYTRDFIWWELTTWAKIRGGYDEKVDGAEALAYMVVCVVVVSAAVTWASWKRSGVLLRAAWLLAFSIAFVPTAIPFRAVVNMEPLSRGANIFLANTRDHYHLGDEDLLNGERKFVQVCKDMPQYRGRLKTVVDKAQLMLHKVCEAVDSVPYMNNPIVNTHPAKDAAKTVCSRTDDVSVHDIMAFFDSVQGNCRQATKNMEQIKKETGNDLPDLFAMVESITTTSIVAATGVIDALLNSGKAWPAALSLGPGLVKGALRAKQLVPESSMPGVFLILLPWLYIPITWNLCNVIVQATGDLWILAVTIFFAVAPLALSMIAMRYHANNPMTAKAVAQMSRTMGLYTKACLLIGITCLVKFSVDNWSKYKQILDKHPNFVAEMMEQVLLPMVLGVRVDPCAIFLGFLGLSASFLFKYLLTAIVATDWMMQETAMQKMFENLDLHRQHLAQDIQDELDVIRRVRGPRLSALVIAQGGSDERPTASYIHYITQAVTYRYFSSSYTTYRSQKLQAGTAV